MEFEKQKIAISISILKKNKFFDNFTQFELEKIQFFFNYRLFFSGQSVYKENSLTDGIFFIKAGHFDVCLYLK